MMSNSQTSQSLQASNLIGHQVLVAGDQIHFDGNKGYFGVDLPESTDNMSISITDATGNTVRQIDLGKQNQGTASLSWDGYNDGGTKLPAGDYKFVVSATSGGQKSSVNALSLETVSSITSSPSGVKLNLSNSSSVGTSDLKQIF